MNNFPLIHFRHNSKFAHPLAGLVYDNTKYEQSCFFEPTKTTNGQDQPPSVLHAKSKSTPFALSKMLKRTAKTSNDPGSSLTKSKIFSLTKRLTSPLKNNCSRNKWVSASQTLISRDKPQSKSLAATTKLDSEISTVLWQAQQFKYPEIEVRILDTFGVGKEELKRVRIELKRYFEAFFKDSLLGLMFKDLADLVERHLEKAIEKEGEEIKEEPVELPEYNSKRTLYDKLCECQRLAKLDELYQLIRTYCLPRPELRQIFLRDVLNLLELQLYQQFGLNKENQYVFLTPAGRIIADFAEIKFSSRALYAASKDRANEYYQKYLDFVKHKRMFKNTNAFREALKQNFREQVASGNIDDSGSERSLSQVGSRGNISQAQNIINFKNDKTSYGRVRLIQYLHKRNLEKKAKVSPRAEKKQEVKKKESEHFSFSMEEKIELEFKKLKRICDYGDSVFKNDEACRYKILLGILVRESVFFKNKSQQQVDKILSALGFISKEDHFQSYASKTITDQEYTRMRRIINCTGDKHSIVHFVDHYLKYDEYGELQKDDLRDALSFIIGNEKKTCEVILKTIWSWLQKNEVIINETLRRNHMQLLFEQNKLVYYFLISLIFGTNDTTALELAQEILVDK